MRSGRDCNSCRSPGGGERSGSTGIDGSPAGPYCPVANNGSTGPTRIAPGNSLSPRPPPKDSLFPGIQRNSLSDRSSLREFQLLRPAAALDRRRVPHPTGLDDERSASGLRGREAATGTKRGGSSPGCQRRAEGPGRKCGIGLTRLASVSTIAPQSCNPRVRFDRTPPTGASVTVPMALEPRGGDS